MFLANSSITLIFTISSITSKLLGAAVMPNFVNIAKLAKPVDFFNVGDILDFCGCC